MHVCTFRYLVLSECSISIDETKLFGELNIKAIKKMTYTSAIADRRAIGAAPITGRRGGRAGWRAPLLS